MWLIIIGLLLSNNVIASQQSDVEHTFTPSNWLTDMGNFIPDNDEYRINNWISQYEKSTSIEIAIITLTSLGEEDVADYAQDQFTRLGIGKKHTNGGLLLVFSMNDRKMRIHTGYGLEGALPDGVCLQICKNIKPHFKEKNYEAGIMGALEEIKSKIGSVEASAIKEDNEYQVAKQSSSESNENVGLIFIISILLIMLGVFFYRFISVRNKIRNRLYEKSNKRQNILSSVFLNKNIKENLIKDINDYITKIDFLKTPLPTIAYKSNELVAAHSNCEKVINSIVLPDVSNLDNKSNDELSNIKSSVSKLYGFLNDVIITYNKLLSEKESYLNKISNLKNIRLDAIVMVNDTKTIIHELSILGVSNQSIENIEKYDILYDKIYLGPHADLDELINLFIKYENIIQKIRNNSKYIKTIYNQVLNSKKRIENWENEYNRYYSNFMRSASRSEVYQLENYMDNFKTSIGKTDYNSLSAQLELGINLMTSVISKYERKMADEKREAEELEARIARKARREREEREARNSSSYYTNNNNYYSSPSRSSSSDDNNTGSSFGGFGGGESGGGGASSDW